eukprot:6185824-Pleurochrysis_carterae.AAC.3
MPSTSCRISFGHACHRNASRVELAACSISTKATGCMFSLVGAFRRYQIYSVLSIAKYIFFSNHETYCHLSDTSRIGTVEYWPASFKCLTCSCDACCCQCHVPFT